MISIVFRPLQTHEANLILELPLREGQDYFLPPPFPMATGRVQRWGLWKDERLVGFVEVVGRPPLLWISRLGVHKTFQGQGYGQQVLEKLIGQLRRNRRIAELRAAVHAENLPARRLFEKLGFSQLSQEAVDNELIYALSLR